VGLLWGAWHFPLFSGSASSSGAIPQALYLSVLLFSWLPPYRVLMMWVHDHTKSLLVLILMHVPIDVGGLVVISPAMSGVPSWPLTSCSPPRCGSSLPCSPWPAAGNFRDSRSGDGRVERDSVGRTGALAAIPIRRLLIELAAATAVSELVYAHIVRPCIRRWGATDEEVAKTLAGDKLPSSTGYRRVSTRRHHDRCPARRSLALARPDGFGPSRLLYS
jgi:hypothetical protein